MFVFTCSLVASPALMVPDSKKQSSPAIHSSLSMLLRWSVNLASWTRKACLDAQRITHPSCCAETCYSQFHVSTTSGRSATIKPPKLDPILRVHTSSVQIWVRHKTGSHCPHERSLAHRILGDSKGCVLKALASFGSYNTILRTSLRCFLTVQWMACN